MAAGLPSVDERVYDAEFDRVKTSAGTGSITLDVYSKTLWDERVEAVLTEPEEPRDKVIDTPLRARGTVAEWEPCGEPQPSTQKVSC